MPQSRCRGYLLLLCAVQIKSQYIVAVTEVMKKNAAEFEIITAEKQNTKKTNFNDFGSFIITTQRSCGFPPARR